jgi:FkbM family methyltransferase
LKKFRGEMKNLARFLNGVFHLLRVFFSPASREARLPEYFLKFMNPILISDYGKFLNGGGRPEDILPIDVSGHDVIVVLGGFYGESTSKYAKLFPGSTVYSFEPIPSFVTVLKEQFKGQRNVKIIEKAAWVDELGIDLRISGDATGIFSDGNSVEVETVDFSKFLSDLGQKVGILESNIEGGEYDLFTHLLKSTTNLPRTLLIQFHNIGPESPELRNQIRTLLEGRGYSMQYSFDWVWERWDLIEE